MIVVPAHVSQFSSLIVLIRGPSIIFTRLGNTDDLMSKAPKGLFILTHHLIFTNDMFGSLFRLPIHPAEQMCSSVKVCKWLLKLPSLFKSEVDCQAVFLPTERRDSVNDGLGLSTMCS